MHPHFALFQRLTGLGDEDAETLARIAPLLEPRLPGIVEALFARLSQESDAIVHLGSDRERLRGIFAAWLRSLFVEGRLPRFWDEQLRVGETHAEQGIPLVLVLSAFAILRSLLADALLETVPDPAPALRAKSRTLDACLYLAETAYERKRQHDATRKLRRLTQVYEPEAFFIEAAKLACDVAGADGAALIVREADTLRYQFFHGLPESYQALARFTFPADRGASGAAVRSGEPVYVPDYPGSAYAMREFVQAGLQGSLALPLPGPEGVLGVLAISWFSRHPPERLSEDRWDNLRLIGDMLGANLYRAQLENRLEGLATRDMLTGLPNRRVVSDRIIAAAARAMRHQSLFALLFVDLDGFKPINDRLGHAKGDETLLEVAKALQGAVRRGDSVLRYAGDEFLVLLEEAGYVAEIEVVAERLLEAVRRDVEKDGVVLPLSASVGVTVYPFDEGEPEDLVHHADLAMYAAKQAGGDAWRLYDGEVGESLKRRQSLLPELRQALDRHEFVLYWQPIVALPERHVTGAEALLRWRHPLRGLLAPGDFLDALENSSLMQAAGHWILEEAFRQADEWHGQGRFWDIHINLAAAQLEDPELPRRIEALLTRHPAVERGRIWLEIVERVALRDIPATAMMIRACRNLGVHFSLDDFGTGAAALQYLVELECSGLKLDRSLVGPMRESGKHHSMVRAMVDMAHALSIKVVAEGVEEAQTADLLAALGVRHAQGYLFSRPVPADELS